MLSSSVIIGAAGRLPLSLGRAVSVEQTRVVDAISIDRETGQCKLSISDHLPWDSDHLLMLQEKLNAYLAFLESGEVYSAYPQATGKEFSIIVIAKYRPNDVAAHFFEQATAQINQAGFALHVRPLAGAYDDDTANLTVNRTRRYML